MQLNIGNIEMFETPNTARMKQNCNGENFTHRHRALSVPLHFSRRKESLAKSWLKYKTKVIN